MKFLSSSCKNCVINVGKKRTLQMLIPQYLVLVLKLSPIYTVSLNMVFSIPQNQCYLGTYCTNFLLLLFESKIKFFLASRTSKLTARGGHICEHTISHWTLLELTDATKDPRVYWYAYRLLNLVLLLLLASKIKLLSSSPRLATRPRCSSSQERS